MGWRKRFSDQLDGLAVVYGPILGAFLGIWVSAIVIRGYHPGPMVSFEVYVAETDRLTAGTIMVCTALGAVWPLVTALYRAATNRPVPDRF